MDKFSDKFEVLDKSGIVYRTITKQLNKQGVNYKKNWEKDIMGLSAYNDSGDKLQILTFFNKRTKEMFTTCSVCHDNDEFDPKIGIRICASRMAKHTDFIKSITHQVLYGIDFTSILFPSTKTLF